MIKGERIKLPADAQPVARPVKPARSKTILSIEVAGPPFSYCFRCGAPAKTPFVLNDAELTNWRSAHQQEPRRFYLCSRCELLRQKKRSLAWAKEAGFFSLSFAVCSWLILSRPPIELERLLASALIALGALRLLFFFFFQQIASRGLNLLRRKEKTQHQSPADEQATPEFDRLSARFCLNTDHQRVIEVFSNSEFGAKVIGTQARMNSPRKGIKVELARFSLHACIITVWLTILLSWSVELKIYQSNWGKLRVVVDHQYLATVTPSALENPSGLVSLRLWPGQHHLQVVDEFGAIKTDLKKSLSSHQSYLLAYLSAGQCARLDTMQTSPQGLQKKNEIVASHQNLYILPKVDRWLTPWPSELPQSELFSFSSQSETRYALRIQPCNSLKSDL